MGTKPAKESVKCINLLTPCQTTMTSSQIPQKKQNTCKQYIKSSWKMTSHIKKTLIKCLKFLHLSKNLIQNLIKVNRKDQ